MYLKIVNESQLDMLYQLNKCLGKNKLPECALGLVRRTLENEDLETHDYIALFIQPLKNDTTQICNELRLFPYTIESDEECMEDIETKKESKISWSCYMIRIKETGARVFLIYSMKKKDVWRKDVL